MATAVLLTPSSGHGRGNARLGMAVGSRDVVGLAYGELLRHGYHLERGDGLPGRPSCSISRCLTWVAGKPSFASAPLRPEIPVVMISGYTEPVVAQQLDRSEDSMVGFLQKPFLAEDLSIAMGRLAKVHD